MIISDKKFLEKVREEQVAKTAEDEKDFIRAAKFEKVISSVGGAIITYASTRSMANKENKNWLDYTLVIIGGALLIRGTIRSKINKDSHEGRTK